MSKVLVNLPFEVKEKELEFWDVINYLFLKYDDLEDQILAKFIDEWVKTEDVDLDNFKSYLKSKVWN